MERFSVKLTVGLILINDNKVLLMRRCNTGYMDGMYALVSGHVEARESLKQAIVRESNEEVGIKIDLDKVDYVTMIRDGNDNEAYINFFLVTNEYSGVPSICEPNKCDDLKWFDLDNLPVNMIPADRRALNNYFDKKYFDEINF